MIPVFVLILVLNIRRLECFVVLWGKHGGFGLSCKAAGQSPLSRRNYAVEGCEVNLCADFPHVSGPELTKQGLQELILGL